MSGELEAWCEEFGVLGADRDRVDSASYWAVSRSLAVRGSGFEYEKIRLGF